MNKVISDVIMLQRLGLLLIMLKQQPQGLVTASFASDGEAGEVNRREEKRENLSTSSRLMLP